MYDIFINLVGHSELSKHLKLDNELAKNYRKLHDHEQLIELHFIKDLFIAFGMSTSISLVVFIIELIKDLSEPRKHKRNTKMIKISKQNNVKNPTFQDYINNDYYYWYAS